MKKKPTNRYTQILERIFRNFYKADEKEFEFDRDDIVKTAAELKIGLPKNIGDILYSFRYRTELPDSISDKTPPGYHWVIRPAGRGKYKMALAVQSVISPSPLMVGIKIPDATPGIINQYALNDEQALLAIIRYNRLIDIFTGLTCYSLQSHLRTTARGLGQVETDEVYIGIDKRGAHYILPIQAKGRKDKIGIIQIEQDLTMCKTKFPHLITRAIAAQFTDQKIIVLFEFESTKDGIRISQERHYRLCSPDELGPEELREYQSRSF